MNNAEPWTDGELATLGTPVVEEGIEREMDMGTRRWIATVADRDAKIERLEMTMGTLTKVLRYILFVTTGSNEIKADLCDDVQMAADRQKAEIERLRSGLHDAEAFGDFQIELRDRLSLKENAEACAKMAAEATTENERLREALRMIEVVYPDQTCNIMYGTGRMCGSIECVGCVARKALAVKS